MKLKGMAGEYAFRAMWKNTFGWHLTDERFFSQKEVTEYFKTTPVIWPVEVFDNGAVYVPEQEELE